MYRLFTSNYSALYIFTFLINTYIGYSDATKINDSIASSLTGLIVGLCVGIFSLVFYRYTIFIPDYVNKNETKSFGAIIGVSYFLLCIAFMVFSSVIAGKIVKQILL